MINGLACTISQIDIVMSSLLNETEVEVDSDLDEALAEGNVLKSTVSHINH